MNEAPQSQAKPCYFSNCIDVFRARRICLNSKTLLVYILILFNYWDVLYHLSSRGKVRLNVLSMHPNSPYVADY